MLYKVSLMIYLEVSQLQNRQTLTESCDLICLHKVSLELCLRVSHSYSIQGFSSLLL